jgi:glycosyltransferase involved in cell wall biosynthesis
MKVLFLMFVFYDMNQSFNMYTSLVEEFKKNGHDVYIVAPHTDGSPTGIRKEKGIDILRVKTLPIKNVSNYLKGISNLLLPSQFKRALRKYYSNIKFDLVIIPTPPITLVDLSASLKVKHQTKVYLMLRDIFPQNAVDLGFIKKNGIIYKYFRSKEKKLYKTADHIGCMSQGNIDYVLNHNTGLSPHKFHILENFQYIYQGFGTQISELRTKYGIDGKFVVIFGGNMGKPQQLENVLELAKRCMHYPDVIFLLLGDGIMMQRLAKKVEELNITNIRIKGKISKKEYQDLLTVCDIGLISLNEKFTVPNIPSKSLDYFNVGLPILASIDRSTDYNKVLDDTQSGLWSYAGDHDQFKRNFDLLYHNSTLRKSMGANGQRYHRNMLTPEIAYQKIMKEILR